MERLVIEYAKGSDFHCGFWESHLNLLIELDDGSFVLLWPATLAVRMSESRWTQICHCRWFLPVLTVGFKRCEAFGTVSSEMRREPFLNVVG